MVAMAENLVDKIWVDRPARPLNIVMTHPLQYSGIPGSCEQYSDHMVRAAGKKWSDKIQEVRVAMEKAEAIAVVVTALDEVAC